jgi:hypothetical protein
MPTEMATDRVDIERVGGFAGFGGPGSRLRSRGSLESAQLSAADRQSVDALFTRPPKANSTADGFIYRLTRHTNNGPQTVDVPEEHVPAIVKHSVKDEIV